MKFQKSNPNLWMYKCNKKKYDGDWNKFFSRAQKQDWGGTNTIEGRTSLKILRERMIPGDFILAYQTDSRAAIGLCRLKRFENKGNNRRMLLEKIECFEPPIKLHDLKKSNTALRRIRALRRGGMETLYETSNQEAQILFSVCGLGTIAEFVSHVGRRRSKSGGGFGNPESNKIVETKAIEFAKKWYRERGWRVRLVAMEKPGFDLQCKKNKIEEHVEVKGVSGTIPSFQITAAEKRKAKEDRDFVLFVVTSAHSKHPIPRRWHGSDFLKKFDFEPLQFIARPKM